MLFMPNTSVFLLHLVLYCNLFFFLPHFKAQDSAKKAPRLRLFELNFRLGLGSPGSFLPNLEKVSAYTSHKEYVSGDFVAGYSDTAGIRRYRGWFGSNIASEFGFGTSFQFNTTSNKLLKRIKPRFALYHSSLNLFRYQIGIEKHFITDTLHFVNPNYPPLLIDSSTYGAIIYSYKSRRIYAEVGANFDLILTKPFILYTGFLYGYGLGYHNTFNVTKEENESFTHKTFREANSFSSRIVFPLGLQVRFGLRRKIASSFLAELRVGSETNRLKNQSLQSGVFFSLNAGFRFYLNYFK
jgi:hypothetical protein